MVLFLRIGNRELYRNKIVLLILITIVIVSLAGCTEGISDCQRYWDSVRGGDKFELCESCGCTNMPMHNNFDNRRLVDEWTILTPNAKKTYHILVERKNNLIISITNEK